MSYVPPLFDLKIRDAAKNNLKSLNLSIDTTVTSKYRLSSIPAEIFELTQLEELNLSGHVIRSVPAEIGKLQNLRVLSLEFCNLTSVSEAVCDLQHLSILRLWGDRAISLQFLSRLKAIVELDLVGFHLETIPSWIQQLSKLESLNLSVNYIASLPSWIGELDCLVTLWLANNRLFNLPDEVRSLKKLASLSLFNNQLKEFPEPILSLENLQELDLSGNEILEIPPKLLKLDRLTELDLADNPVEIPPPEIVSRGLDAIREYLRQLEAEGTDHLYEAKLLIVGEPGAGKTSLANKIRNPAYTLKEEDSTKGIEVLPWTFVMKNSQPFNVNIWDFGGQEIYHATHQFFLTKRSLYALIADTRKDDTDFYYWLSVIELLSDNSPLLIIKNEKQDRHREINMNQLRGQFSNLEKALATNLATNRGLDDIVEEIKHYISRLPHVGAPLPKPWVKVREVLEREPGNYISLTEYLRICQDNGFSELNDKMQLLGYLHDLGVCLHFDEDPLLRKTVILKPNWGTDAVYKVLDNKRVIANLGKFDKGDLANIWREPEYSEMLNELLQLMINFGLAYRIPNSKQYIAPQLLTENQADYEWDERNNLILRYTYEFMPKGIITQFIVARHEKIARQDCVWKSGVILEDEQANAEVIEYYGRREIKVRVSGKRKKDLMTIVMHELDKVHSSYPRLKFNKLIPCNCSRCKTTQDPHFYRFETLQRFVDNRQDLIQCEMSFEKVNVRALIEDVFDERESVSQETIFISYSHKDKEWLDQLETMLRPMTRMGQVVIWADTKIKAGSKWKDEIHRALAAAKVAVLLVSKHFLDSDFIAEIELPPLLVAAEERNLRILWVPISDSMYKDTEIAEFQAASDPSKPLDSLSPAEANTVLVRICEQIKEAANL